MWKYVYYYRFECLVFLLFKKKEGLGAGVETLPVVFNAKVSSPNFV